MQSFRSQQYPDPEPQSQSLFQEFIKETLSALIPALIIAFFINVFIAQAAMVEDGPSMQPNLYVGDRMMTEKVSYYFHEPRRGDIVLADEPGTDITLVKRVIGLPGETISVHDGHAYINGEPIDEPWVANFGGQEYSPKRIPDGYVFLIGDNRLRSYDSRALGPIPLENIKGRVVFLYWPLDKFEIFP